MFKITKENTLNLLYVIGVIFIIVFGIPILVMFFLVVLAIPFFLTIPSIGETLFTLNDNFLLWIKDICSYPVGPESTPIGSWILVFFILMLICMYILEHSVNGRGVPYSQ